MSHDIIADALNQIMNAKRAKKESVTVKKHSKVLIGVLEIAKSNGYVKDYSIEGNNLEIKIGKVLDCRAIKPRFNVNKETIDRYLRRYLPGVSMGIVIISTNKGIMIHSDAMGKNLGGALIAYFY